MADNTGLSLGYRIMWRIRYIGVSCFGPAQLGDRMDPKERLQLERANRVAAAHKAAGTTPKAPKGAKR